MKKILAVILCFALILPSVLPISAAPQTAVEGIFEYQIEYSGEATLTGVLEDVQELFIPDTLGGYPVTAIMSRSVMELNTKVIVVPESVKMFYSNAIQYCYQAEVYVLGKEVNVGSKGIHDVSKIYGYDDSLAATAVGGRYYPLQEYPEEPWTLEKVNDGIYTYAIRDGEAILFSAKAASKYTIPESFEGCPLTQIAPYCFASKGQITQMQIPDSVRSIGRACFDGTFVMMPMQLPSALEYVGNSAFLNIQTEGSMQNLKTVCDYAFCGSGISQIELGEGLEFIGEYAFAGNSDKEVTIPASVKTIEKGAFASQGQYGYEITLTVLSTDAQCKGAFEDVTKIIGYRNSTAMDEAVAQAIDFVDIETGELLPASYDKQVSCLKYRVFYDHAEVLGVVDKTTEFDAFAIEETVDGRPVTILGRDSMSGLHAKRLMIPNTVTTIKADAFCDCYVQEIVMTQNLQSIPAHCFAYCKSLRLIFWEENFCEITIVPTSWGETNLFLEPTKAIFVSKEDSYIQSFLAAQKQDVLPSVEGITYLTDGVCVCSTDGNTAKLNAWYYAHYEGVEHVITIPETICDIPITTIASGAIWDYRAETIVLGENVSVVEENAFSAYTTALLCGRNVSSLPFPLFASNQTEGYSVYGYKNTYAERYCKEYGYKFYPLDSVPFEDVSENAWYFDAVYYCYWTGLMNGTSHTDFDPSGTTTRAMVAKVLYNMSGAPYFTWEYGFKDVHSWDWYSMAVNWCRYYGLAQGTSTYYFSPNDKVTREQVAAFFYRYAMACGIEATADGDLNKYSDAKSVSNYAKEPMRWAVGNGIINGRTSTTLDPQGYATRAEIATILMRFIAYAEQNLPQQETTSRIGLAVVHMK